MGSEPQQRRILSVSLSPHNPDARVVAQALERVPCGERSAQLLAWAAAYLTGRTAQQPLAIPELGMTEAEIDALLDDF